MRLLLLFLLLATCHFSYGQTGEGNVQFSKHDYLQKSKKQKTWFWITGGTGAALFTVGMVMYFSEFGDGLPGGTGYNEKKANTGEALMYVGGGLVLVSIPLRFAYKRNEKIAASLSFKNTPAPYLANGSAGAQFFPSLSFKIVLAK